MKTSKLKARRFWANYYDGVPILHTKKDEARFGSFGYGIQHPVVPVAVIPLDDTNKLVRDAANIFSMQEINFEQETEVSMRAALEAIGVLPKQRKGLK